MISNDALRIFINDSLLSAGMPQVTNDSLLFKERHIDSMSVLSLIGFIEKHLKRRLTDEEIRLENFASITAITAAFHD